MLRRAADGSVSVHADVSGLATGHLNDMIVDRHGRAYAGNFGFDLMGGGQPATAAVVRIDPDGSAVVAAEDLWFPNGTVITDDGTLIVAETFGARLTAFTIQPDGTLADRRVWAQIEPTPEPADTATMLGAVTFAPDGCALDAEGHVWAANALGGPLSRVAPGGQIVDEVAIPEGLAVFACGLGGDDGRTLMACAAPDFHEEARNGGPRGGAAERRRSTSRTRASPRPDESTRQKEGEMNENLADILIETTKRHGDRPVVRLDETVVTYAALEEASARVAGLLRERGVAAGDRVGIMLPERPVLPGRLLRDPARGRRRRADERPAQGARGRASTSGTPGAKLLFAWHEFGEAAEDGRRARPAPRCIARRAGRVRELLDAARAGARGRASGRPATPP